MRTAAVVSAFVLVAAVVVSLGVVATQAQERRGEAERLRAEAARLEHEARRLQEEQEAHRHGQRREVRETLEREAHIVERRIGELERHLRELEATDGDERERDEVGLEIERHRDLLHDIHHRMEKQEREHREHAEHHDHHHGPAEEFEGRMHHLRAAIEHLEHLRMHDVVKELQHRAEKMEADFHREHEEREREHAGHREREHAQRHEREHQNVARAIDELRHAVERLNDQMAELRQRLDVDGDREEREREEEERKEQEE